MQSRPQPAHKTSFMQMQQTLKIKKKEIRIKFVYHVFFAHSFGDMLLVNISHLPAHRCDNERHVRPLPNWDSPIL